MAHHRYLPAMLWLKNAPMYDKAFGVDYVPKNADDFKRILQTLTRPNDGVYGIAGAQNSVMWVPQFSQLFGAPNGWRLESDGKLTKDYETPEYKETLGWTRDLYASGVFHPDSTSYASGVVARARWRTWPRILASGKTCRDRYSAAFTIATTLAQRQSRRQYSCPLTPRSTHLFVKGSCR